MVWEDAEIPADYAIPMGSCWEGTGLEMLRATVDGEAAEIVIDATMAAKADGTIVALKADIKTDASPDQIDELKTRLAKRCPVSAILRKSGTEVIESWNIVGS